MLALCALVAAQEIVALDRNDKVTASASALLNAASPVRACSYCKASIPLAVFFLTSAVFAYCARWLQQEYTLPVRDLNALLLALSDVYEQLRELQVSVLQNSISACFVILRMVHNCCCTPYHKQADTGVKSSSSEKAKEQWQAPDMFKRQTTKYWCKPEHVVQLKVAIIKHLPLLVYDQRTRLAAGTTAENNTCTFLELASMLHLQQLHQSALVIVADTSFCCNVLSRC
jgi:VTC domain